jgi:hypothetical protein
MAKTYNPYIEGWINYYGHFYRTQLRPTLKRIDVYVIRWARRKFKRLRHKTKGARDWFARLRRAHPTLFAHWQLCHGNGRTSGAPHCRPGPLCRFIRNARGSVRRRVRNAIAFAK